MLGDAIEATARQAGLLEGDAQPPAWPAGREVADPETRTAWVELAASHLGIEAEPFESSYADTERMVQGVAPAIVALSSSEGGEGARWLAVSASGPRYLSIIAPDRKVHRVRARAVRDALCGPSEASQRAKIDVMLESTGVAPQARERVAAAILAEQLGATRVGSGWLLRLSPGASVWRQAMQGRLMRPLLALIGVGMVHQGLQLISWWVLGRGVFGGHFERVWLWAWVLVLFSGIPLQILMNRAQGRFATGLSIISKNQMLFGVLKLHPEEVRHQGVGQFLGRVMDADSVELLSFGGGLTAVASLTQIFIAVGVLAAGLGGWVHAALLLLWLLVALGLGWHFSRESRAWVDTYRGMTNDLVERMVGHRTRLAQESPSAWHLDEDRDLDRYLQLSERVDRAAMLLEALPRTWMVVGLVSITLLLLSSPVSPVMLATSLGGVLLSFQALSGVIAGVQSLAAVNQAWEQVGPLFRAARRHEAPPSIALPVGAAPAGEPAGQPLLLATDLSFRYRERGQYTLDHCSVQVHRGDRVLLQGPSGSGKSTLAAVLSGLRSPDTGLLLLRGYDRPSVGAAAWRQRVAVAPQFHENHVFAETFAFNLLMGRRWPPTPDDLQLADLYCRELGLGELLDRMPAGLQQMVGESGWQLSHGERSRLFIARALLQNADVMILDESFAALDPKTLAQAMSCVLHYAPTLLVIAHP